MTDSSCELIGRWQQNDPRAAAEVLDRYTNRLLALARRRLSSKLARRVDAEDVVQSTYRSFFARARDGQFAIEQSGDLWRLLAAITLHKLARQARRHRAARRSIDREAPGGAGETDAVAGLADREPSVVDIVAAAEQLQWLLRQLEPDARLAVQLRMENHTIDEIAQVVGRSERSVRCWLVVAKGLLSERLAEEDRSLERVPSAERQPHTAAADPAAPLKHADYHLQTLIGSGGMSKVYLATERATGRRVAVKVLRKRLRGRPRMIERFVQEATIVARISHPRIVPIHGVGRMPDGGYFLVMDYIDGGDLVAVCRQGPLAPQRAAQIVAGVAEAVQRTHDSGVIHRDLKPGNVLVDAAGNVFVTDFGFAWLPSDAQRDDSVAGTIGFMAPEQIDQSCGQIGAHTDVYGLGALLVTLLAGRPPHADAPTGETASRVVEPATNLPSVAFGSGVPAELLAICQRCLASRWQDRFETARAVADELCGWLDHFHESCGQPPNEPSSWRQLELPGEIG